MPTYGAYMILKDNERLDYVNDSLELIQDKEGLTFGTDALLLAGFIRGRFSYGIELGGGTGIISMLLLTRRKLTECDCLEVQGDFAELIERNAEHNGLSEVLHAVHTDLRDHIPEREADIVFTNPPYMKVDGGRGNVSDKKNIARHEVRGDIREFCFAAGRMLKFGGHFFAVYRQDRLPDLLYAMKEARIEAKRMTFVHANSHAIPSMVLVEGKRGARGGLKVTRPLIIYRDKTNKEYTEDMQYIMKNGSFPADFR